MNPNRQVPSPCTLVCRLDDQKVCLGCRRTLKEIVAWTTLSDEEKRKVLERLGQSIE